MEEKLMEAKKLLQQNGYLVIKITERMEKDMDECSESDCTKDCTECSCSMCVVQDCVG